MSAMKQLQTILFVVAFVLSVVGGLLYGVGAYFMLVGIYVLGTAVGITHMRKKML